SCADWINNGFCDNTGYTLAQRQSYCGILCGLCTSDGQPINSCVDDATPNCVGWASNGFCTSTGYSTEIKKAYCCKTCA
ncbi:hypothetical protein PENTCL1PPCAC_4733, partial [Pristionchus entomophagus]